MSCTLLRELLYQLRSHSLFLYFDNLWFYSYSISWEIYLSLGHAPFSFFYRHYGKVISSVARNLCSEMFHLKIRHFRDQNRRVLNISQQQLFSSHLLRGDVHGRILLQHMVSVFSSPFSSIAEDTCRSLCGLNPHEH